MQFFLGYIMNTVLKIWTLLGYFALETTYIRYELDNSDISFVLALHVFDLKKMTQKSWRRKKWGLGVGGQ